MSVFVAGKLPLIIEFTGDDPEPDLDSAALAIKYAVSIGYLLDIGIQDPEMENPEVVSRLLINFAATPHLTVQHSDPRDADPDDDRLVWTSKLVDFLHAALVARAERDAEPDED